MLLTSIMISDIKDLRSRFQNMKARCYKEDNDHYKYYGGKGVTICDNWLSNINNFIVWALTNGFEKSLTIDRHNGNGDYSPTNCRWVDRQTQAENRNYHVHKTQYRGVRYWKIGKYSAQIQHNGKVYLGQFTTADEAALAFNDYVIEHNLNRKLNIISG